ncbi:MAG: aminotransferase class I/II-fold pyridoxal phosphate-dependent enzyme [Acidimicrobiia bacterium]
MSDAEANDAEKTQGHRLAFADQLSAELERLDRAGLRRTIRSLASGPGAVVDVDGREVLLLASNDYLGLAGHQEVVDAAVRAATRLGVGSGSARLVTGGLRLHEELEAGLAALKGTEDAVLFSSGYLANLGTISSLVGPGDAVFCDFANHASIVDGARLSRASLHFYRHGDGSHLDGLLTRLRRERDRRAGEDRGGSTRAARRILVVTDSVFSMDGDLAPLPQLVEICERHGALLMVDEAHATGVVGPEGRGAIAHFQLEGRVPVVMGTLSKALGSAGGFVAGDRLLCDVLRNRARTFIYDTALSPPATAAALQALRVLAREPARPARVLRLARALASALSEAGYDVLAPAAAIVPVIVGDAAAASDLAERLLELGILVPAIRPPTIPRGTARLRATMMASHSDAHLAQAVDAFRTARAGAPRGVGPSR